MSSSISLDLRFRRHIINSDVVKYEVSFWLHILRWIWVKKYSNGKLFMSYIHLRNLTLNILFTDQRLHFNDLVIFHETKKNILKFLHLNRSQWIKIKSHFCLLSHTFILGFYCLKFHLLKIVKIESLSRLQPVVAI